MSGRWRGSRRRLLPVASPTVGAGSDRRLGARFLAFTVGQLGFLEAFAGLSTATRMVTLAIVLSATLFAASVLIGRLAVRRLHPLLAIAAFPAAWTPCRISGVPAFPERPWSAR